MGVTDALNALQAWASEFAWRALGALLVLVAGWLVAKAAGWLLFRMAQRNEAAAREMRFFLPAMVQLGVLVAAGALALDVLGIAGPVIGVVVTVGLAVGLLNDVFNGLRNLALQSFRVGDIIELAEDGVIGQVQEVNLFATTLRTRHDTEVIVPNRKLVDRLVTRHPVERGEMIAVSLALAPGREIGALEQEIRQVLRATPGVISGFPPEIRLTKVEADAITFTARFRASPLDAEQVMSDFLREAKKGFDEKGIAIRALGAAA